MAFASLVCGNLALILVNRSQRLTLWESRGQRNPALWWIVGAAAAALLFVLQVPAAARIFRFAPIDASQLALGAAAGIASVLWYEGAKRLRRSR